MKSKKYSLLILLFITSLFYSQEFVEVKDQYSNILYSYKKIHQKLDGSKITDQDVDGVLLIKKNANYYTRMYEGNINVKWFGAVGDGITDDTKSIQTAINSISNLYPKINISGGNWQGGGVLFFPKGKYNITKTILIRDCISLLGESRTATQIHCVEPMIAVSNILGKEGDGLIMSNSFSIKNFLISQGTLELQGAYSSEVDYCTIMNLFGDYPNGIIIRLSADLKISNTKFFNIAGSAILFENTYGNSPSTTVLLDKIWAAHCKVGLNINGTNREFHNITTTSIENSIFEYNDIGILIQGHTTNLSFRDIHFEQNKTSSFEVSGLSENLLLDNVWCDNLGDLKIKSSNKSSIRIVNARCPIASQSFKGKLIKE